MNSFHKLPSPGPISQMGFWGKILYVFITLQYWNLVAIYSMDIVSQSKAKSSMFKRSFIHWFARSLTSFPDCLSVTWTKGRFCTTKYSLSNQRWWFVSNKHDQTHGLLVLNNWYHFSTACIVSSRQRYP